VSDTLSVTASLDEAKETVWSMAGKVVAALLVVLGAPVKQHLRGRNAPFIGI